MIWWFLLAAAAMALLAHWRPKNAVWGTATLGTLVGVVIAVLRPGFDWWIVGKAFVIATIVGLALEWLPRIIMPQAGAPLDQGVVPNQVAAKMARAKRLEAQVRDQIITDYGGHLERHNLAGGGVICDVERLPHPKEIILRAICEQIGVEENQKRFYALIASAQYLADYQEGVGDEPLRVIGLVEGNPTTLDPHELARMIIGNEADRQRYLEFEPLVNRDLRRIMSLVYEAKNLRDPVFLNSPERLEKWVIGTEEKQGEDTPT